MARRLALILANGAYLHRPKLSRPAAAAAELARKLHALDFQVQSAIDETLAGMQAAVEEYLGQVSTAAEPPTETDRQEPLLLVCAFCGHGSAGRFLPVDCASVPAPEETFCFFEDLLFKLLHALESARSNAFVRNKSWKQQKNASLFHRLGCPTDDDVVSGWKSCGIRILIVIESCRRLVGEELAAYQAARARCAHGKRHLLPCMLPVRRELASLGGADWDAARMAFVARQLGAGAPQLLFALSSESTTPSYDVAAGLQSCARSGRQVHQE
ncbi:HCN4 [Symbiodinium natans]|uniref:HCN4 protein n=1 Tax=Symbiodinium natans TaxID=878477 RepID=A0A812IEV9_9DINO|nr:HCN4 [Symbiodinium natans]